MVQGRPSCVVLGGGGFIGTNLCRRLIASGLPVRAFGHRSQFADELKAINWIDGDFADAAALAAAIKGADVVFHLIHGTTPYLANLDMASDLQHNVIPTISLLRLCKEAGVGRLVFLSTGGTIYGCAEEIPTPETAATQPITSYAISKLAIEKYLALAEHLDGLNYRVLRVTNAFGPYQLALKNQGLVGALISRAMRNEPIDIWGDGAVIRDFIYVDDILDALEVVADDQSAMRVFNIGSGEGRSVRDVIASIESVLATKLNVRWTEKRSLDVPVSIVSIERARRVLHWAPKTSFEQGVRQTIAWWRGRSSARAG